MDFNLLPHDINGSMDDENLVNDVDNRNKEPQSTDNLSGVLSDCEPYVGMVFESLEATTAFWNKYGRAVGFSTKIRSTKTSKAKTTIGMINARDYACSKEGKKGKDDRHIASKKHSETRCGCPSIMKVRLIKDTCKFKVASFVNEHNHPLEEKLTTHYLRSHRNITNVQKKTIDVAETSGLGPKATYRYMSLEAGGSNNVGFIAEDIKSYLRTLRETKLKIGEANTILEYFRKKKKIFPNFFQDYQYDRKGRLTNIFWADSKMIVDYQAFGDVIMFDTTFGTNKATRPLGIFTGFNNHRQCVVFGACLLFSETIPSFAWVFKTFLDCHGGKNPIIIFTDQDAAMKAALGVVMPSVRHCLCSWHIVQNATKKMRSKLQKNFSHFLTDFKSCMYKNCEVDEFEKMWSDMTEKYNIVGEPWLDGIHDRKAQWSVAYRMNLFNAGVRSTQMVECANGKLKKELGTGITMRKFFKGFDYFVDGIRERERTSDVKSRQSSPHIPISSSKILKHASQVYTPRMFSRFSKQFDKMHNILLDEMNFIEGPHIRNAFDGELVFRITYDPSSVTISCACCIYEMYGYLCAHILRVFDVCCVHTIPDKYIMKRWTIYARSGFDFVDSSNPQFSDADNIAMMMSNLNRLVCRTKGKNVYVDRIMKFIADEEEFIDKNEASEANESDVHTEPMDSRVTGLKDKKSNKGCTKKRALSCLEKPKRRENTQTKKQKATVQYSSQVTTVQSYNGKDVNLILKL